MEKHRIYEIIQIGQLKDRPSRAYDLLVATAILLNLGIALFETFDISTLMDDVLFLIEIATVLVFTVDYGLRLWTAEHRYPGLDESESIRKYVFSLGGIIDFLSFFPFYLPFIFPEGVVAFRMFRVARIFRLFRVNQYSDAMNIVTEVLGRRRNQLLSSAFILLILMTGASILMYNVEHAAQPDVFANAFSGFWWAASTLTTVGYGDIYPLTLAGKILGVIITFLGVGIVAIPTGIISAGFVEHLNEEDGSSSQKTFEYCPCCGENCLMTVTED